MTEQRRRRKAYTPQNSSALTQCVEHAERARALGSGPGAEAEAQRAMFFLLDHLGGSASALTDLVGKSRRASWLRAARFLDGCPNVRAIEGLSVALAELDRGIVGVALTPIGNRRGGKSRTDDLLAMRAIVEGADQFKADIECDASERPLPGKRRTTGESLTDRYERGLEDAGVSRPLVEKYRNLLLAAAPELHPRAYYSRLQWGEPLDLVRRAARVLQKVRRDG